MWPTDDELLTLWQRLVADPDTAGAFATAVLPPLEAYLAGRFPRTHPDDVATAADETLLAFFHQASEYNPDRGRLAAFLRMAARRDLINLIDKERRHNRGRIPWEPVELTQPARNDGEEGERLADSPELRAAVEALPECDRHVLDLMLDGERDTAVFAAAMGLTDRPADVQADEVKRAKDRIKARLRRAGGGR